MACEKPIIVTNVGGLMEVVNHGEFGIVIPKKNSLAIADAVEKLINEPDVAEELGKRARENVLKNYDWQNNLKLMISEYNKLLK